MDFIVNREIAGKKTIEYCRKSTESEDKQIFSLEDQHLINKKTAERYNLKLIRIFKESASAKKRGRPLFNEMIKMIEERKANVILTWALNRLARNAVDGALLIELMDQGLLFAIITPGKIYYNSGDDKLLLQIEFGLAKKYSDDLSPTIKRGMHSKAQRGFWPGTLKLGYMNIHQPGEEPKTAPDPERFPLLRKAIDLFLTGNYSVNDILRILNDRWGFRTRKSKRLGGKKLSKSVFYQFLRDPFYYGEFKWGTETYKLHPSIPRLITEEEYWKIQELLGRKGVKRPKKYFELPYRGLFKCGECGRTWLPYIRAKKLKNNQIKEYPYIRCNHNPLKYNCHQKQMSLDDLEKQISKILEMITIPKEFCDWAIKWLKEEHREESSNQLIFLKNLNYELEKNQIKLNRALDLHLEGLISKEEYLKKKEELEKEREEIKKELATLNNRTFDWISLVEKTFNFAKNVKIHFDNGDADTKTAIVRSLGSNFYIKDGKVLIELSKPFLILKENHEALKNEVKNIEPNKEIGTITQNQNFKYQFPTLWRCRELNPGPKKHIYKCLARDSLFFTLL